MQAIMRESHALCRTFADKNGLQKIEKSGSQDPSARYRRDSSETISYRLTPSTPRVQPQAPAPATSPPF